MKKESRPNEYSEMTATNFLVSKKNLSEDITYRVKELSESKSTLRHVIIKLLKTEGKKL